MGAAKPDAVLDAVLQLVNLEASWFPRGTFLEWAGDTWSPGGLPQVLVFTSLYFVMVVGLILYMESNPSTKPNTKHVGAAHNLGMSILSAWMFFGGAVQFWSNWSKHGGYENSLTWCDDQNRLREGMEPYYYFFFVSKFLEYFDSVLLILGRKYSLSVGFSLQVYHHSTTASIAWVAFWGEVPSAYIGLLSNCFVHIVMYLYFALVSMDRGLRQYGHWVTKLQLIQFWITFFSSIFWLVYKRNECWSVGSLYVIVMYFSYLIFFLVFNQVRTASMKGRSSSKATKKGEGEGISGSLRSFVPPCAQTADDTDDKKRN
eukprot:m.451365 g.451365  ORF g.451365 m.451365 type:complete len:316 (+) comp20143_c0_seq1:221-1168(+)